MAVGVLLAGWGFWSASAAVAGVRVLFHGPLHGALALQGTLPAHVLVGSTLLLFSLDLFLSAALRRFGSVWPAVFAHALPMSALNLVQDAGGLAPVPLRAFTALSAAAILGTALLLAPRTARAAPEPAVAGAAQDASSPIAARIVRSARPAGSSDPGDGFPGRHDRRLHTAGGA